MSIGQKALYALCEHKDTQGYVQGQFHKGHFVGEEVQMFSFIEAHLKDYGVLPAGTTLVETFGFQGEVPEPSPYYVKKLMDRFTWGKLNRVMSEQSELMAQHTPDATEKVRDNLEKTLTEIRVQDAQGQVLDFNEKGMAAFKANTIRALKGLGQGLQFGWPSLDNQTKGLQPGDVVSYVGRPAMGKTWKMLYTAHHCWWKQKASVLFVSMEMSIPALVDRIGSLHLHAGISRVKQGMLSNMEKTEMETSILSLPEHPGRLWIMDGSMSSTPEQIFTMAAYTKPDIVFIDGAYLMRSGDKMVDRDRWGRMAEGVESVKKYTSRLHIPSVLSYQFSRDVKKKKNKDEQIGLEDIYGADAIGQTSSIVLGLLEAENVGNMKKRKIDVLKGREGQVGKFEVLWNFEAMDFREVKQDGVVDDGEGDKGATAPGDYFAVKEEYL